MKSLVEEASSVVKAIEKAWNRAGNPQTFSVKVFETPETNFFGFTTKSAKVGIFFEEEAPQPAKKYTNNRDNRSQSSRPYQKGRDASFQTRDAETEQPATRQGQSRQPRAQQNSTRTAQPAQAPRQEAPQRSEAPAPRTRDDQRSGRTYDQPTRTRNNDRSERPDRNDRQAAPVRHEQDRPARDSYVEPSFEEKRTYKQDYTSYDKPHASERPVTPPAPRYERDNRRTEEREEVPAPRYEQDVRHFDDREEGSAAPRQERDNRRSDNRGGDRRSHSGNRQSNRGEGRPQRAQRHEFDEHREMVNMPVQDVQDVPYSEPSHTPAPEHSNTVAPSLIPQKKVLKVSGRRYSAPVKADKDSE